MTTAHERLALLGLRLPEPPTPQGSYVPARRHGRELWVAGHTDRTSTAPATTGLVGTDLDVPAAREVARRAALNVLAAADAAVGLDELDSAVFLRGYVVAASGFGDHSQVLDGASDLLADIFGSHAAPARAAIGVATLPGGACVEVEAVFSLR